MKTSPLRSPLIIASLALAFATLLPPVFAAPEDEANAIMERIVAKSKLGKVTELDLAPELNDLSDLQNKVRGQKSIAAEILLVRATVYEKVIQDAPMALMLFDQVATDYPGTAAGMVAAETVAAARATADDPPARQAPQQKKTPPRKKNASPQPSTSRPATPPPVSGSTPEVGNLFSDFSVQDLDGDPLSTSQYRGKILLVHFWAAAKEDSVAELDAIMSAYRRYHDKGFEIISVSEDRDRAPLINLIRQRTITWLQHFDKGGVLARRYSIDTLPATFLLDRQGKVVATNLRGAAALERALARQFDY